MMKQTTLKLAAFAAALAFSGVAGATVTLTSQYTLNTTVVPVTGQSNEYTFNYSITNNNQGYAYTQTGLDGFTIYIPTAATVISATEPVSYIANQGVWTKGPSPALDLSYGGDTSQNMVAPAGYQAYTFWGQNTGSVYQLGSTATFSITLGNVSVGNNTVGISTYFGGYGVPTGQDYVHNQYGNYTTFTTNALSAVTAVPEPETYAMLLAGLGAIGFIARRRRQV
ncbi:PEP-CTERM sorting domain-containing protein [Duganella aceris]|uniref:PEP-CTERM sorting domain-containing protein n=1 Tax=Duganella aceris TaxID=2703883 RepID=UPI001E30489B|nr:PEP-CTERM sorting domain-containing protein [Duganella aceris]